MSSRSSVHKKLRTNAGLTKEAEAEVRRVMGRTLKKLEAVEMEIARLQDRLVVLGQRKQDTESFIEVHQGLLSPIRRLVPEILQEIFWLCLPVAHKSVLSAGGAPLILGRVCSQWRRIAYSTAKLWCSLHITVLPFDDPRARAIFEASEAWITRSGILPLSLSISTATRMHVSKKQFLLYLKLITKHAQRWKTIHLHFTFCDTRDFLVQLDADRFPMLESFHIDRRLSRRGRALDPALWRKDGILAAPLLRVLSTNKLPMRPLDLPVQWNLLTGLNLMHSDLHEISELLTLCSNLEMCAFNLDTTRKLFSNSQSSNDSRPNIVSSKLRTLRISGYGDASLILLDTLATPSLRHFTYCHPYQARTPPPTGLSASLKVFRSFFQRLNQPLEELEFETSSSPTRYLMEFLSLLPGLKRLSLIYPSSLYHSPFNDRLLLGFIPSEHKSHCQSCSFEAEQVEEYESIFPSSTTTSCFCPNLEVLNIDYAFLSKHVLFEYLRSRLVDYDKYNVARLRRFSVAFRSSVEDYDMMEEIDGWAEELGLVVKLGDKPLATAVETPPLYITNLCGCLK